MVNECELYALAKSVPPFCTLSYGAIQCCCPAAIFNWAEKRKLLEIICLNRTLGGVEIVPEMRKPFDVLAEGLLSKNSRAERI